MRFWLFGKEIRIGSKKDGGDITGDSPHFETFQEYRSRRNREAFERNLPRVQLACQEILDSRGTKEAVSVLRTFNRSRSGHSLFSIRASSSSNPEPGQAEFETVWYHEPSSENVSRMLHERLRLLPQLTPELITMPNGRILLAEIDVTLHDGASEWASGGFIDIEDLPPIDTWFHMLNIETRSFICAWIPAHFVPLVDAGIRVNVLESFVWLDDVSPAIY